MKFLEYSASARQINVEKLYFVCGVNSVSEYDPLKLSRNEFKMVNCQNSKKAWEASNDKYELI